MDCKIEFITPERAKQYLRMNKKNRKLSKAKNFYAQEMLDGLWKELKPILKNENFKTK